MATATDAELILKLYELRTETTMREARKFAVGFNPAGFDELLALQRDLGSDRNGYWRQVISYWEMASAFVLHGALDADLFLDTTANLSSITPSSRHTSRITSRRRGSRLCLSLRSCWRGARRCRTAMPRCWNG